MRRFHGRMTATAALVLWLGLPVSVTATAQGGAVLPGSVRPELGSIGTQRVVAGRRWQLHMRGRDADGEPPRLTARDLPPGATFAPLGKGWYVLDWTPPADLVAPFLVTIEAIDARVPTWRTERIVRLEVVADPSLPRIAPVPGQIVSAGFAVRFDVEASLEDGRAPLVRIAPMPPGATFDMHIDGTYVFQWQTDESDTGEYRLNVTAMDPDRDTRRSSVDTLLIVSGDTSQESLATDGAGAGPVGVAPQDYGYGTDEDPAGYVAEDDMGFYPSGGTGEELFAEDPLAEEMGLPEYLADEAPEYVEEGSGVVYDENGYPVDADGNPVDPNSLY